MKISKITVDNFRSVKHAEITLDNFNIFVGQNNHGKTNFFEAIDWFYSAKGDIDKIRFGRTGDAEVCVEIEFTDIQDGISKMKNAKNKTTIQNLLGDVTTVKVKRSSLEPKTVRTFFDVSTQQWKKPGTGFDAAFNDFLPRFEYVHTQMNPLEMTKYGKKGTPIATMLSGVLTTILEEGEEYEKFRADFEELFTSPGSKVRAELNELSGKVQLYLEKQFPDCNQVFFEVVPPVFDSLLKNFETSIDDGIYTDAEEKGDGMQRALMLAIIQAYADFRREHEKSHKYFLFFIDEGELHLHPTAQRKLKNALLELAEKGDQVFINTHSSVLVVDGQPGQTIFKVEKIDKETNIQKIEEAEKPYIVYELLGGSPADLLLPRNFLIVEGKSDLEFITRVIARHYPEKPPIQVIPAGGDTSKVRKTLSAVEEIFKPLGTSIYKEKVVICTDQNDPQTLATFLSAYPSLKTNNQFFELTVGSIEEYYPSAWKKTTAEVKVMSSTEKVTQAQKAGDGISKNDFEQEMTQMHEAMKKCWAGAFD